MIASGDSYSLSEQIVGTWIDGKPLYQRTFIDNTVIPYGKGTELNKQTVIQHGIENIDKIFFYDGFWINGHANYAHVGTYAMFGADGRNYTYSKQSYQSIIIVHKTSIGCYFGRTIAVNGVCVTVRYTKTTD